MRTRAPKRVWIIFDSLDGPHLFRSKKEADKTLKKWEREAKDRSYDSYWDISDPIEYQRIKT